MKVCVGIKSEPPTMRKTIMVIVENRFGVLARVAGLFSARGFNIESLSVARNTDPTISQMTVVVDVDEAVHAQILKQLAKLVDTIEVTDLSDQPAVARELVLVKVKPTADQRVELLKEAEIFRAKVVDVGPASFVLELTGDEEKISGFLRLIEKYEVEQVVRTGKVAMARGARSVECTA